MPILVILLMMMSPAQASTCPAATDVSSLSALLDAAEKAYWTDLEPGVFAEKFKAAEAVLECLGSVVEPRLAARVHRVEGLNAWLASDADATSRSFTAARYLDYEYQFPQELPPTAPERALFARIAPEPPPTQALVAPKDGSYSFDGTWTNARPLGRPTIYQRIKTDKSVVETLYLKADQAVPGATVAPTPDPATAPVRATAHPPRAAQWVLGGVSLAALATGAVIYGSGLWGYEQDSYTNLVATNPDAANDYYTNDLYPRMAVGAGLAIAGGVGLAGTGVWLAVTPNGVGVGASGTW